MRGAIISVRSTLGTSFVALLPLAEPQSAIKMIRMLSVFIIDFWFTSDARWRHMMIFPFF